MLLKCEIRHIRKNNMQKLLASYSHLEEETVIHISLLSTENILKFLLKM